MAKRQRDCAVCGAPVGIIGRQLCCRCVRRQRERDAKQSCPDCGRDRVLVAATGRCMLCSRRCLECGLPVRRADATLCKTCRRRADLLARQQTCPRCGKPGYLRAETGWCGSCSRPGPPRIHRESARCAVSCAATPAAACAHAAGNGIRSGPSFTASTSRRGSRIHRCGSISSLSMLPRYFRLLGRATC